MSIGFGFQLFSTVQYIIHKIIQSPILNVIRLPMLQIYILACQLKKAIKLDMLKV